VTHLRTLVAFVPSDAPSGPDLHSVYVAVPVWLPSTSWQNVVVTMSGLPVALLAADAGFDVEGVAVLADLGAVELVDNPREGGAVMPGRGRVRSEREQSPKSRDQPAAAPARRGRRHASCALPDALEGRRVNNVTRTYVTGCDVLYRHVPTVGACRITSPRVIPEGLLSVTDGPVAALRYPSFGAGAEQANSDLEPRR
jgi:hypothetical protein